MHPPFPLRVFWQNYFPLRGQFQNCQVCEFLHFGAFLLHHSRLWHSFTPLDAFKPNKHTHTSPKCSQTPPPDISGHFRTTTDTNRHQTTPTDIARHPKKLFKDVWHSMLTSIGVCWCLMTSFTVICCLQMSEGCLSTFSRGIWVLFIDLFRVWMRIRVCIEVFRPCIV